MGSLGFGEVVLIVLILVVVFGGAKLPEIGDALGRALRSFRRGLKEDERILVTPVTPAEAEPKEERSRDQAKGEQADGEQTKAREGGGTKPGTPEGGGT